MERIYLDHNATTPVRPEALEAMLPYLTGQYGNPSSIHSFGREARTAVEQSRLQMAALLACDPSEVVFTGSGTESDNQAIKGAAFALRERGNHIITTRIEHHAVLHTVEYLVKYHGCEATYLGVDQLGLVDPAAVARAITDKTILVSVMHANNETGAIQPIAEFARAAHAADALILVDGAQAGGHLEVDLAELGADAWACSGHKGLLGPMGVGVLYLAASCRPEPLVYGGTGAGRSDDPDQPLARPERYEAGTPNTPGIAGLGAAARLLRSTGAKQRALEQRLTARFHEGVLGIGGYRVLGPPAGVPRVPIVSVVHEGIDPGRLAAALDERWGIAVRSGLHCSPWAHRSAGTQESGAVRFGFGWGSTDAHVDTALEALAELGRGAR